MNKEMKHLHRLLHKCVGRYSEINEKRAKHQQIVAWEHNGVNCSVGFSHTPSDVNAYKSVGQKIIIELKKCGIAEKLRPKEKSKIGMEFMVMVDPKQKFEAREGQSAYRELLRIARTLGAQD